MSSSADRIMAAALELAATKGYRNVTRKDVAERAECSIALVTYRMGPIERMQDGIIQAAIYTENLPVLRWALVDGNQRLRDAPVGLRMAVVEYLAAGAA